ncbi:NADH dehydrogenase subunit 2 (mitochondrion) [Etheostoma spectabile]|uniref:NADH-ubiquinone oxidoreductase chain 2 n=1 Tax=Etheostoma spectabile spectabile TaxID=417938 RepID=V5N2P8_9PERO|nr:NADH dehydrogenase subunit 2 [Etheostoma spectabile]AHA81861.1 NADH dehydrogenase subunit 2 [Etheostoma spectabile spectabile]AHA81862.1 NADH dehydrogenase subunit 2 [Etheostoma spectabile spectabile]AHA81867.1 NADH dehydrogenase subunit 2 [Etheostoma spectabile spectabile]AHA81883.1 NADH dehydrogenase subunit 2 [Etheostoma spectabile spectabile]QBR54812.1 NADH dehydrogenase subunit 2 [Etheostoma spectabile]
MNPYILAALLFGLGLGTTVTFASSHWLLAWMGLEMNTLAIIPLMAQHHHPRAVEATTKYFLTQATAAAMILFASTTNAWLTGQWDIQQMSHPLPITVVTVALALKIGLAPVHAWLPEVMQGLDLVTGLVLSTWQKLAPFALLLQLQPANSAILVALGLASTLAGGWGGLNQTQLRKILAYSSIAHLGWMILILQFSPSLTLLTLLTYFVMTLSTFLVFKLNKSTSINMLATSWAKAPALTALAPLILLSLGGLPPLTGFMPKWLILQELAKQDLAPTATLAAMSALLSLYFYLRLTYAMTLTMSPNSLTGTTPWRLQHLQFSLPLALATATTLLLLPLAPAVVALLTL